MKITQLLHNSLGLLLILIIACDNDDRLLESSTQQIEFSYEGGTQTFTVECDEDWCLYGVPDWLSPSAVSGIKTNDIKLTAMANDSRLDREQVISIRSNDGRKSIGIRVVQFGDVQGRLLSVDNTSKRFFNGISSFEYDDSIVVNSTIDWTITGPHWVGASLDGFVLDMNGEIRKGTGTIYLRTREEYQGNEAREGIIRIQSISGNTNIEIPVVQLGIGDIKCTNVITLSDGFACKFKYGYAVNYFKYMVYEGSRDDVSARDVVYGLKGGPWDIKNELPVVGLKPETDYSLCIVGFYDLTHFNNTKVNTESIRTSSNVNQPRAVIENVRKKEDGWYYDITMNQFANGYYNWVLRDNAKSNETSLYAFAFAFYKMNNEFYYTANRLISVPTDYGSHFIATWAVGSDGKLSGVIDFYRVTVSNENIPLHSTPQVEHIMDIDARMKTGEHPLVYKTFNLELSR